MNKTTLTHRFTKGLHLFFVATLLAGLALSVAPPQVAHAATYVVDRFDDNAGATACTGGANDCSLRGAITAANAAAGADTITLPAGTYTLSIGGTGDDTNATGDLDITDDLTINGVGEDTTFIDGGGIDRVLHIVGDQTVVINDVTIRNGKTDDGADGNDGTNGGNGGDGDHGEDGGGIYNEGDLTLNDSTVSNNTTGIGGNGGQGGDCSSDYCSGGVGGWGG